MEASFFFLFFLLFCLLNVSQNVAIVPPRFSNIPYNIVGPLFKSPMYNKEWKLSRKLLLRLLDFKAGPITKTSVHDTNKKNNNVTNNSSSSSSIMHYPCRFWYYSGILRNPLSGKELVGIEGLEIIERKNDIIAESMKLDDSVVGAYRSKKIFIYVNLTDRSRELTKFRLSPVAPQRQVNPVVEFSHTVVLRLSNSTDNAKKKFVPSATVVCYGGRSFTNAHLAVASTDDGGLEVVNHMRGGRKRNKINRWLSFASPQSERAGRSQEYYTMNSGSLLLDQFLRINSPSHMVTYKRIGEAPPWFAVGQACSTELTGRRFTRLEDIPSSTRSLINRLRPEFLAQTITSTPLRSRRVRVSKRSRSKVGIATTARPIHSFSWPNKDSYTEEFAPWYSRILTLGKSKRTSILN